MTRWHTIRTADPLVQLPIGNPMSQRVKDAIIATLREHPLCKEIVLFLLENEAAMDSAKGIATWWVRADRVPVQAALDGLIACGVISAYTLSSGTLYGLTRNAEIRNWLRATYGRATSGAERRPAVNDGAPMVDGS